MLIFVKKKILLTFLFAGFTQNSRIRLARWAKEEEERKALEIIPALNHFLYFIFF